MLLFKCSKGRIQLTWLLTFESYTSKHNLGDSITASGENMVYWEDDLILSFYLPTLGDNSVEKPIIIKSIGVDWRNWMVDIQVRITKSHMNYYPSHALESHPPKYKKIQFQYLHLSALCSCSFNMITVITGFLNDSFSSFQLRMGEVKSKQYYV